MSACLCLLLIELCTTDCNVMTMLHEVLHTLLKREEAWTTLNECDAVYGERALEICHLEELVHHHVSIRITLHVNDDTHTLTTSLIVHVRDTVNLAFLYKLCNILNELLLVYAVRNLGNDNLIVRVIRLNLCLCTDNDTTTTCLVCILNTLNTIDIGTCREVWSLDILHQSIGIYVRIVDICAATINHLTKVMGRDISSHTYSDTVTAIYQQVRNLRRHHGWLCEGIVEVVSHINGILLEVIHDVLTHLAKATLGVTHGSSRVTIY